MSIPRVYLNIILIVLIVVFFVIVVVNFVYSYSEKFLLVDNCYHDKDNTNLCPIHTTPFIWNNSSRYYQSYDIRGDPLN